MHPAHIAGRRETRHEIIRALTVGMIIAAALVWGIYGR